MDGCKSCIADLQTTNFFVKAKSANDGSGRLESFLEQSFNRRAVLRLAYGRREGQDTYSIPINPLLSSELPLPQINLPVGTPVSHLKHKDTTNSA
jgi:hypothetical protein